MTKCPPHNIREMQARLEIGHTHYGRGAKWTLFFVGLLTIYLVPAMQTYRDVRQNVASGHRSSAPQCCDILAAVPRAIAAGRQQPGSWSSRIHRGNTILMAAIDQYEQDLQTDSFLTRHILPPTQELLIHAGSGNEQAYVGRRGWLFYRPGVDYCTGPGFLDPHQLARRRDHHASWRSAPQPDPRVAIVQFHEQLASRNIRLIVMPVPDKATIHPERLSARYGGARRGVHNPSYDQWVSDLESQGVLVCDVTDALIQYREQSGRDAFLATDTHWRPEAMRVAASQLAQYITDTCEPLSPANSRWLQTSQKVHNLGDIAMMLGLRTNQNIFVEETVTIDRVTDEAGADWQPDPNAEVLLLGDSFANIYSLPLMHWGQSAGLAEQLSVTLDRPVDTILRNDDGAYATREILSRELVEGHDRLAGKRVVVWQFAARELAVGDWRMLDMTLGPSRAPAEPSPVENQEWIVTGTIAAKSAAPRAGQMPYAHHIFTVDLADLQVHNGTLSDQAVAVYLFSMRDHQNTPAFSWPVGKQVTLKLQPWKPHWFAKYGRINRTETDNRELEDPWWGEVMP